MESKKEWSTDTFLLSEPSVPLLLARALVGCVAGMEKGRTSGIRNGQGRRDGVEAF